MLVVVSVVLTALLARTWGHRRLLGQVQEELDLLKSLPDGWDRERRSLEELAARDVARYIRLRRPAFPLHRLMFRRMDVALVGLLLGLFGNMSFVPGPDAVKALVAVAGFAVAAVALATNVVVLFRRGPEISEELVRSGTPDS